MGTPSAEGRRPCAWPKSLATRLRLLGVLLLAGAYCGRGDADQAIDLSARSLALARERDVRNLIQAAATHLGAAYTLAGRATEAVACLEEAVETGQPTNRMDPFTLVSLGRAYLAAGRPDDAIGRAREAWIVPRADQAHLSDALHLLGEIRRPRSRRRSRREQHSDSLSSWQDLGIRTLVPTATSALRDPPPTPTQRRKPRVIHHATTSTAIWYALFGEQSS